MTERMSVEEAIERSERLVDSAKSGVATLQTPEEFARDIAAVEFLISAARRGEGEKKP